MPERTIPDPTPSSDTIPFWDAAKARRFTVRACKACGRVHWYPRAACPFCASTDTEWRDASGRGRIYSYSYMRRAAAPYVLAYVTLEEGPTMMTNIVDCDVDSLAIGQSVEVVFHESEGGFAVPLFRPSGAT